MSVRESNRRIKFSYQMDDWDYETGDRSHLKTNARKLIPSEYQPEMDGTLYCPACFTNLNRVPKEKEHFTNGRDAYFSHMTKFKDTKCDLKSIKPAGKKFNNWEEANQAIDDENLVIINSFLKSKPESKEDKPAVYDETPVEDVDGPETEVAIGRHKGESFTLPSKITTVAGLCRNFDENLYKYFHLPGKDNAIRLIDLLKDIRSISEANDKPRLYYGLITSTTHLGQYKRPTNIRMTYLDNDMESDGVAHFTIKLTDEQQKSHGIGDHSVGRIVLMYGVITINGMGLCFESLEWGEFSLLPDKYKHFLE
jgi:hypothetical protein